MTDIFISYSSEDRSRIEPLAKALEDQGWKVFWDRTIPAGKTWRQVIGEALETARSVIVAWSETSVESSWVQEEADRGRERNILIPILIDNVKPPLGFGAIQAADLISWEPTQSSPEFEKLIFDLSAILGPSPLKVKEKEQKHSEEELRLQQDEEEERRKEQQRRAEEARERKDAEAKRKAEEEQKRKVLKAEIKPDKSEPSEIKPSEPKPDAKAPTEPRPSPPIPPKSRRSRNALIFGAVAGAILLLMTGGWFYYKYQQKQETLLKIGGFKEKVEALKVSAADIDNQELLEKFSNQRKVLSDQVKTISKKAAKFGLTSQFEELQNLLKQVQIQEETLFKIKGFKEQVQGLENAVTKVDNLEQIEKLYSQRNTLNKQVAALNEQATESNLESRLEELQKRLTQIQIQKQEIRIKLERYYEQVEELERSIAKVDNQEQLKGLYRQRDKLNNQVEVLKEQTTKVGLGLQFGQFQDRLKNFNTQLAKKKEELIAARKARIFVASAPDNATIKILNIDEPFQQGMGLEPGEYHVYVSSEGYEPQDKRIELGPGEEKRINFKLEKITPKVARLFVETVPEDATVRIENIPKFYQGIELEPGIYHVEVAAEGYETQRQRVELGAGEKKRINFELEPLLPIYERKNFDPQERNLLIPSANVHNPRHQITLEAWFNTDALGTRQAIIYKAAPKIYYQYNLELRDTGKLYFALAINGVRNIIDQAFSVEPQKWYHVAAIYDGTWMRLYLNGNEWKSPLRVRGSLSTYNTPLDIGVGKKGSGNPDRPFKGSLAEVRIWNIARTGDQIRAGMNKIISPSDENGLFWSSTDYLRR